AIAIAVVLGLFALVVLMFASALIYVPAVVFRLRYGMYFFGARYQPLMPYMYPPPPPMAPPYVPPAEPAPAKWRSGAGFLIQMGVPSKLMALRISFFKNL